MGANIAGREAPFRSRLRRVSLSAAEDDKACCASQQTQPHSLGVIPDATLSSREKEGEGSTSGVSTVNSVKSDVGAEDSDRSEELQRRLLVAKEENMQLMHQFLTLQEKVNCLLRASVDEQHRSLRTLFRGRRLSRPFNQGLFPFSPSLWNGASSAPPMTRLPQRDIVGPPPEGLPGPPSPELTPEQQSIRDWLLSTDGPCLEESEANSFLREGITMKDVTVESSDGGLSREDLQRLELKVGVELRVWRAICSLRHSLSKTKSESNNMTANEKSLD
ncbi:unnamed protein product [Cyprideis torosa]|uniref:Uncharacterized protein n=1 Tax=Cyprideis torosa TaxID=163714 RepID=A0A7R8ZP32_9CRUS|nr:unnamed protein product [Cyprideis torosa]CAG0899482.1 unnamed protein product [Cyprideis torosa]